jgi:hypothetical protein
MAVRIIPESIRDFLNYDPETGLLTWIAKPSAKANAIKVGNIAGTINGEGYVVFMFRSHIYLAHRVAWFLACNEQPEVIDHINHNRSDNRIANLRNVNQSRNILNQKRSTGVCWIWNNANKKSKTKIAQAHYKRTILYRGRSILAAHYRRRMAEVADMPIGIEHLK